MKIKKQYLNFSIFKFIFVIVFIVLAAGAFFIFNKPKITSASWWNDQWLYRKALTINHAQVAGDLTDFPVLVSLTSVGMGAHAQADGDDIVFVDAEGRKLSHEIESFATTTGALIAWVKLPVLSSTHDADIFMYYGNAGAANQETPGGVWDDDFKGVWHMDNSATASTTDSTKYANNGSTIGPVASTTSKIGNGLYFDGDEDRVNYGDFQLNNTGHTLCAWIKMDASQLYDYSTLFTKITSGSVVLWDLYTVNATDQLGMSISDASGIVAFKEQGTITAGSFTHVCGVYAGGLGASSLSLYINGSLQTGGASGGTGTTLNWGAGTFIHGSDTYGVWSYGGVMDEARVSNVPRSAAWIQTEYNNQNDPSAFFAVQTEETGPGPVAYWSFDEGFGATAHDESGQKNDGAITGAVWKDESECVSGQCLYFDGSVDYVDLPATNQILPDNSDWSASLWFKYASSTISEAASRILTLRRASTGSAIVLQMLQSSDSLDLMYWDGAELIDNSIASRSSLGQEWHHISVSHDETRFEVFLDGVKKLDIVDAFEGFGAGIAGLGRNVDSNTYFFQGFIDEVKIYPYARTADQVKQDYNAGLAGVKAASGVAASFGGASDKWLTDGLVGYWKFDESATTSGAIDSSGNGNTGTFYSHASTTGGKFGNGGSFDGNGDYIEVDDSASLSVDSQITISSWFNPDETLSGTADYFQSLIDSGAYSLYFDKTDGKIKFTLDSDTAETWSEVGTGAGLSTVYALTVYNGELYVGGSFTNPPFDADADRIAKWDGANWSEVGTGAGLNGTVYTMTVYNGELYVGGAFYNPPFDTDADYIAKWNGANWSEVGSGAGLNNSVYALAVYNDELYIGGFFYDPPFDTDADYIAKWNGTSWSEVGTGAGLDLFVYTMTVYNGELYVGGLFSNPPFDTDADYIAKWNGTSWSEVGTGAGLSAGVLSLAVYNGELYVGGDFTNPPFDADADRIAKWNGTNWSEVGTGAGLSGQVRSFLVYNGELYVGGAFTNPPFDTDADYIAKWNGTSWSEVGTGAGLSGSVYALTVYNSELYVGGAFTNPPFDADADRIAKFSSGDDLELDSTTLGWTNNTWYHISGTYDGVTARLYINGQEENSVNSSIAINNSSQNVYIGKSHGSRSTSFGSGTGEETVNGRLDETRIYNRALSPDEVRKLYEWAPGPVAHWRFDEKGGDTAYDSVASSSTAGGNDGGVSGATWDRGKYGGALSFDGVDDSVEAPDDPSLDLNAFTLGAWVKFDSVGGYHYIVSKAGGASNDNYYFYYENYDAYPGFYCGFEGATGWNEIIYDWAPPLDDWLYVTCVFDDAGDEIRFYVNGILKDSLATTDRPLQGEEDVRIGLDGWDTSAFDGAIDDVRIYNYARTQKQILEDMLGSPELGGGGGIALKSPILHLAFEEGYGTLVNDSSIYGRDFTFSSSYRWFLGGRIGKAFFNVSNGRAYDDADDNDLDFGTSSDFSVSAWIAHAVDNPAATQYIVDKHDDSGYEGYALYMTDLGYLGFGISDTASASFPEDAALSAVDYADGNWHHVLGRKISNSKIELFVDGKLVASDTSLAADATLANSATLYVGDNNSTDGTDEFLGVIDEVKIWNFALNDDEIKTEYNGSRSAQMGEDQKRDNYDTDVTGQSKEYCIPGDTAVCTAPVLEYTFDEKSGTTANDTSGSRENGTLTWMSTSTNGGWTRGKFGSGVQFDGVDDYISLTAISDMTNWSMEMWYKPSETVDASGGGHCLYNANSVTDPDIYLYHSVLDNGELRFRCFNPTNDLLTTTNTWVKDRWYHIALTYNNTGTLKSIYVNGILENYAVSGCVHNGGDQSGEHRIGSQYNGTYPTFGAIDGFRMYDYVRTPAQIAWDYNRGAPVAHWSFNECEGSTIHDESINMNHGQLYLGTSGVTATGTCASSSNSFWYNGRSGKFEAGGSFDGTNDYVNATDNPSLDLIAEGTISAWIKRDTISANVGIVAKGTTTSIGTHNYRLSIDSSNLISFQVGSPGTSDIISANKFYTYTGEWHHLAASWSVSGNSMRIYIDGILDNQDNCGITPYTNDAPVSIGQIGGNIWRFDGQMDEVKIWNYALTDEQIKQEYNGGAVRFGE